MAKLSISRAWDETRATIGRDGKLLIAVVLALVVLPQTLAGVIQPQGGLRASGLIAALLGVIGQLALIRLALGPATTVQAAISEGLSRFPSVVLSYAILILGIVLMCIPLAVVAALMGVQVPQTADKPSGTLLLLSMLLGLLVLALWARFVIFPAVAVAEKAGPVAALKRSWALSRHNYWRLLAFVVLLLILTLVLMAASGGLGGILGSLASEGPVQPLSLGALVMSLIVALASGIISLIGSVMVAHIYGELAGARDVSATVPRTAD
jgi:hypothetical protein